MTAPLTLPGTIPGLLRRCSPVAWLGSRALVEDVTPDSSCARIVCAVDKDGERPYLLLKGFLSLDLTQPTGAVHAAWWVQAHRAFPDLPADDINVCRRVVCGPPYTRDGDIARLRDLVLRLSGVTP